MYYKVMRHTNSLWFHWVILSVLEITDIFFKKWLDKFLLNQNYDINKQFIGLPYFKCLLLL